LLNFFDIIQKKRGCLYLFNLMPTANANEFVPLFKLFHSMKKREREADNEESHHYPASTIPG